MSTSTAHRLTPRKALATLLFTLALVLAGEGVAQATLQLLKPDPNVPATFVGRGGYSADGLGQAGTGGTVQAEVPAGSTVRRAYLYGTYAGNSNPSEVDRTLDFDGTNVVLDFLTNSEPGGAGLSTARAEVTAQVAAKVGGGGGITDFAVNTDPSSLDGVALVVIFANSSLPDGTIAVLDGGSKPAGDSTVFDLASPLDTTVPNFAAQMSLGSGFSFQGGGPPSHTCGGVGQFSTVSVNTQPLTNCAGNFDDGVGANGGLITVGGVGDSIENPTPPPPDKPTEDDELYNLLPFLKQGDTSIVIDTANPSTDDNLFLAVISFSARVAGTVENCANGADEDGDGLIDQADSEDCPPVLAAGPRAEGCGLTIDGVDLLGDDAKNSLSGTSQTDRLRGGGGADRLVGAEVADCLRGDAGNDKITGDGGDDVIRGGADKDDIAGGEGNDNIRAQNGDDTVSGGPGDDTIKAQARGADVVECGTGKDSVIGDVKDTIDEDCEKVRIVDPRKL